MTRYTLFSLFFFLFAANFSITGQTKSVKTIKATRVKKAPKIDADPSDIQWNNADAATGFYMFNPGDGDPLPSGYETEIKLVYDDAALYILAVMKDPEPEKISRIFGLRDQYIPADNFGVILNPFATPNNNYIFTVFSSGSQLDANRFGNDFSWNAVWKSATKITEDGWIVEMAIPYSALRFQNDDKQTWAIGFLRHIDHRREDYSWTYIDKSKTGDFVQFLGKLTDLKHLKPPVRLSLYPYTSAVHTTYDGEQKTNFGFGMDLKYGLSENYTLDATLIPDFSDTPYDELQLNLGPFEQYYEEKRQFFTEGVDLFNKGHLFYSRRIGSTPSNYYALKYQLNPNEEIVDNPSKVKLINAIKISGRNKNGLGIGFFNAITNKTEATVKDTLQNKERKITTEPYTNYNIFVLDYNFKGNSSVSLINTNVIRQGSFRDANVSGLSFNLYGQKNTLNLHGSTSMSLINQQENYTTGFKYYLRGSKQIKEHKFSAQIRAQDDRFDNNDMGFNRHNNYANFDISYSYSTLKPTKHFNKMFLSFDVGFDHRYVNLDKVQNDFELRTFFTNKKYISYGFGIEYVTDAYDYYEPQTPGRYFLDKAHGGAWGFVSTDYRKKVAIDIKASRYTKFDDDQNYFSFRISPRIRVNNRLNLNYSFDYSKMNNGKGFVGRDDDQNIIFGNRQRKTITNSLGANYYFNTKSALNLNLRHYWAPVYYDQFFILENDGSLTPDDNYKENEDINYNTWNFDFNYTWEFAPGSNLSLLYRNTILREYSSLELDFEKNISNLVDTPLQHSFIMKITYYIDYNTVKNKWF